MLAIISGYFNTKTGDTKLEEGMWAPMMGELNKAFSRCLAAVKSFQP